MNEKFENLQEISEVQYVKRFLKGSRFPEVSQKFSMFDLLEMATFEN